MSGGPPAGGGHTEAGPHAHAAGSAPGISESGLLVLLAAMMFTHILDFVIMMPLGPQFFRAFKIGPYEFGLLVSAYTFSAGATGVLAAFFIDRFDRKKSLLAIYAGFAAGTLLCALSPSYHWLMAGRILAGAFGGILSATVLSIVGDAVPEARRGAAMGTIMASFSVATIAGVPLGLFLAHLSNWTAPFFLLAALSVILWVTALFMLPSFSGHLAHKHGDHPVARFARLFTNDRHLRAYLFMLSVIFAGFAIIPFIAPYLVGNVGLPESQLGYVYLVGGAFTFFSSRLIGKLSDRYGKKRVFTALAVLSVLPILVLTHLPPVPTVMVIIVTTFFMVVVSGRIVPAMALVTASSVPHERGGFMSITTAVQQVGSGSAAFVAGSMLGHGPEGQLLHYDRVGTMAAGVALLSVLIAMVVRPVSLESGGPAGPPG